MHPAKLEARSFPRRHMRCKAVVILPNRSPIAAKTHDVGLGGVCLVVAEPLNIGQRCTVAFEADQNGRKLRVTATAKVAYSILSGTEGFRIGMEFVQMDAASNKALAELML